MAKNTFKNSSVLQNSKKIQKHPVLKTSLAVAASTAALLSGNAQAKSPENPNTTINNPQGNFPVFSTDGVSISAVKTGSEIGVSGNLVREVANDVIINAGVDKTKSQFHAHTAVGTTRDNVNIIVGGSYAEENEYRGYSTFGQASLNNVTPTIRSAGVKVTRKQAFDHTYDPETVLTQKNTEITVKNGMKIETESEISLQKQDTFIGTTTYEAEGKIALNVGDNGIADISAQYQSEKAQKLNAEFGYTQYVPAQKIRFEGRINSQKDVYFATEKAIDNNWTVGAFASKNLDKNDATFGARATFYFDGNTSSYTRPENSREILRNSVNNITGSDQLMKNVRNYGNINTTFSEKKVILSKSATLLNAPMAEGLQSHNGPLPTEPENKPTEPENKITQKGKGVTADELPEYTGDLLKVTKKGKGVTADELPEYTGDLLKVTKKGKGVTADELPEYTGDLLKVTKKGKGVTADELPEYTGDLPEKPDENINAPQTTFTVPDVGVYDGKIIVIENSGISDSNGTVVDFEYVITDPNGNTKVYHSPKDDGHFEIPMWEHPEPTIYNVAVGAWVVDKDGKRHSVVNPNSVSVVMHTHRLNVYNQFIQPKIIGQVANQVFINPGVMEKSWLWTIGWKPPLPNQKIIIAKGEDGTTRKFNLEGREHISLPNGKYELTVVMEDYDGGKKIESPYKLSVEVNSEHKRIVEDDIEFFEPYTVFLDGGHNIIVRNMGSNYLGDTEGLTNADFSYDIYLEKPAKTGETPERIYLGQNYKNQPAVEFLLRPEKVPPGEYRLYVETFLSYPYEDPIIYKGDTIVVPERPKFTPKYEQYDDRFEVDLNIEDKENRVGDINFYFGPIDEYRSFYTKIEESPKAGVVGAWKLTPDNPIFTIPKTKLPCTGYYAMAAIYNINGTNGKTYSPFGYAYENSTEYPNSIPFLSIGKGTSTGWTCHDYNAALWEGRVDAEGNPRERTEEEQPKVDEILKQQQEEQKKKEEEQNP